MVKCGKNNVILLIYPPKYDKTVGGRGKKSDYVNDRARVGHSHTQGDLVAV